LLNKIKNKISGLSCYGLLGVARRQLLNKLKIKYQG